MDCGRDSYWSGLKFVDSITFALIGRRCHGHADAIAGADVEDSTVHNPNLPWKRIQFLTYPLFEI